MAKVFINANIHRSDADAFYVEDNRFVKIASTQEILDLKKEDDEVIDLNNQFVLPGFIDSHLHLMNYGYYLSNLQLADCHSIEELEQAVKDRASTVKQGDWIVGRGYNEEMFKEVIQPTKQLLDSISKDIPIALTRACGHVMIANSKALELAGIESKTDDSNIHYDIGRLEEGAIGLVKQAWPTPDINKLKEYIKLGAEKVNEAGITAVGSDDFLSVVRDWHVVSDAFYQLSVKDELNVRVNEQCEFKDLDDFVSFLDAGNTTGVGDDYFKIGPLKLLLDGSLGARTAAMCKPYNDDPSTTGTLNYTDEDLKKWVALANKFNMPTITHAIGDKSVDQILNVFDEEVLEGNPLHHGLVHCQIMRQDQIDKVIEKKICCYFQSLFIDTDASMVESRVGKELANTSYPFKTLFEGTVSCNGSDGPIEIPNPLKGIQLAITRQSIKTPEYSLTKHEAMDIEQAIDSYTICGAQAFGLDDELGKIEEDYFADFVVLEKDITKIPTEQISETRVMKCYVGGKQVYDRI